MLSTFIRRIGRHEGKHRRRRQFFRPQLTVLEDRVAPAERRRSEGDGQEVSWPSHGDELAHFAMQWVTTGHLAL
jgi:hypothetical protein